LPDKHKFLITLETHNISQVNSIVNNFLAEIRDTSVQNDRLRFRRNLARLGEILAYEMSKTLDFRTTTITTPLDEMKHAMLSEQPVLISIMRAGMPFFEGIQQIFDHADAGFIGAFRAKDFTTSRAIDLGYVAVPDLTDKTVVLADPMLATGKSMVDTIKQLTDNFGVPKKICLLAVIAAPEGIAYIKNKVSLPIELWCGAIDEKLNDKAYIVPGLGDAGDLAYGPKL
jgi:uracil phosphoribosyltransferase